MRRGSARVGALVVLAALATATRARAERLPAWLSIGDTRRAPTQTIPPISPARLAALEGEKHPSVERLRRIEYQLRPDGIVEQRIVLARQFLDEEGVRQAGTLSISARAATDRVFVDEAYVLAPDGGRRPFDPRTIQVVAESQQDLFHDGVEVALPFAQLEAHSTAVVAVRIVSDSRRWPLPWSAIHRTQTASPIERLEIEVRWLPGVPAPAWKTDDPALACVAGNQRLTCTKRAIAGLPFDPEVASWPDLLPHFVISERTSWAALIEIERKLLEPADGGPTVARAADRLVAGVPSAEGRIEKLARFVADEIRYVGLEHGRSAVTPHAPSITLARKFGDCKDKVALFLALARRAGLDGYGVLVATDRRDPRKLLLPSWAYFDHIIACVRPGSVSGASARPICLDATDPNLPPGTLPFGVRDAVTVPLIAGAAPENPAHEGDGQGGFGWRIEIETLNEVACDGTIKETLVRRYRGAGEGSMRGRLRSQNAADRQRWLEEAFQRVMGDKVKPTFSVNGLDAPGMPVELRSVATYPGIAPLADLQDWSDDDAWMISTAKDFRTDNRNHPYVLSGLALTSRVAYEFCPARSPLFSGAELSFESEFGSLTRKETKEGERFVVETAFILPPQTVARNNLARFNRFINTVLEQARIWYGFGPIEKRSP